MSIVFKQNDSFSIGVELEFQLLDPDSFNLTPKAPALLQHLEKDQEKHFKPEFIQSMIELISPPCTTINQLDKTVSLLCKQLESICSQENCIPFAASLHPFAALKQRKISENSRYHQIMADLQIIGRRLITQGLHIHVGMPDKETAILVNDQIRIYLPLLLALSTSSPFFLEENTGFKSYRTKLFESLPRSGIPSPLSSWENFTHIIDIFSNNKIISSIREIWWDVRPHPQFGTVEIRICDIPSNFQYIIALAALIQTLAASIAEGRIFTKKLPLMEIILNNKWQAARYGLDGNFLDHETLENVPIRNAISILLKNIESMAAKLGTKSYFDCIEQIMLNETSAERQLALFNQTNDFQKMIQNILGDFWK